MQVTDVTLYPVSKFAPIAYNFLEAQYSKFTSWSSYARD
jgi:hypothetical protein